MDARWFKGCKTADDKKQRTQELLGYRNAFEHLKEILGSDFLKKEANRDYSDEGWHYRQIAINEYNAVLSDVLKLITIDKD